MRLRLPISIDPEVMSGTPVFEGTRVPVEALMQNLAAGVSLDEFLDNFLRLSGRAMMFFLIQGRRFTGPWLLSTAPSGRV